MKITIGHSPDPDDAFMFYALTHGRIPTNGIEFREHLEDIEGLNRRAERGEFEVSALSLHQYPFVADRYLVMPVGASMGDGYGPIVVSAGAASLPDDAEIAIPGERTTAALLLRLRFGANLRRRVIPFDRIPEAVASGECPFGLLIHEGQLTYAEQGLTLVEDLGAWWLKETGLPTPLGINVIRRNVERRGEINDLLKRSIAWARQHPEDAVAFAMKYGRGLEAARTMKFVGMYVNDFTLDLGERGRAGVTELLRRAQALDAIPPLKDDLFAY